MIPFTWKLNIFSHTLEHEPMEVKIAKMYQYFEVMGQFCDTKVMFIPILALFWLLRLGYDLVPCFKPI